jgi:hypothetical protein
VAAIVIRGRITIGPVLPHDNTKVASFLPGFGKRCTAMTPWIIGPIAELSRYSEYCQTSIAEHLRFRIGILIKLSKKLKWVDDQIGAKIACNHLIGLEPCRLIGQFHRLDFLCVA